MNAAVLIVCLIRMDSPCERIPQPDMATCQRELLTYIDRLNAWAARSKLPLQQWPVVSCDTNGITGLENP
jgi:hypothetical protein